MEERLRACAGQQEKRPRQKPPQSHVFLFSSRTWSRIIPVLHLTEWEWELRQWLIRINIMLFIWISGFWPWWFKAIFMLTKIKKGNRYFPSISKFKVIGFLHNWNVWDTFRHDAPCPPLIRIHEVRYSSVTAKAFSSGSIYLPSFI